MITLNLSYLQAGKVETSVSVPKALPLEIEECLGSLLKISQCIPLKFFVYISSEELKTANYYFELESPPWAEKVTKSKAETAEKGKERLLVSVVLTEEKFNVLMRFDAVLQELRAAIGRVKDVTNACYEKVMLIPQSVVRGMSEVKRELTTVLKDFLPKVEQIVKDSKAIPPQRALIMEEDLQDEFVTLAPSDSLAAAAKKFAEAPYALIGCVFENETLVGIVQRADLLGKTLSKKRAVVDVMDQHFKAVESNKPIHEVIDQLLQDRLLAIPILTHQKFHGVFSIFDALHHNQTLLNLLEKSPDLSPEQTRLLQIELWPLLRNITANQKILALEPVDPKEG